MTLRRLTGLSATLVFVVTLAISCTNSTDPLPNVTSVSYAADIQPIFNSSCGGSACHTNGGSAFGVNLSSYAATMASRGSQYGGPIVLPNNPDASPLVDKIEPNPTHGSRMPLGRAALNATQIQKIRTWIQNGANND
jgi:mono/diheme cytochrome c family protein